MQVAAPVGRLEVHLGSQDTAVGVLATSGNDPVDEAAQAPSEPAWEEFGLVNTGVD